MNGWLGYFAPRKNPKDAARDAIVGLREQQQMMEKKEEHLEKQIEDLKRKAKANVVGNKKAAKDALMKKQLLEKDLDRLHASQMEVGKQINTLEAANFNQQTLAAMKSAAEALKVIHGKITVDKVDNIMASINEQRDIANEIADAISNPANSGLDVDEDELKDELAELEQEELNDRLAGAERAPTTSLASPKREEPLRRTAKVTEEDEDAELRALQAELAM